MPSPSRTSDGKKHAVSGSNKFEELGSSDFRRKSLKREDGSKEWTRKPSLHHGSVEPVMEHLHIKKKTMNGHICKSMIKLQLEKDKIRVSSGVSTCTGSQSRPREAYNVSEGSTGSHDVQKNVHVLPELQIIKLFRTLRLPEDVRVMVRRFHEYVTDKHDVNLALETKLEAFELSLCWNSASLLKYKINKKESLLLAKQHVQFRCSEEEVSNVYTELRKLRKSFEVDLGNIKDLDSTKHCISALNNTKENKKRLPLCPFEGKELLRCNKKVERKLEKRMKKLAGKQQKEIDEFHRIWGQQKVQLLERHRQRAAILSSSHSNNPVKLNELKELDEELAQKMEEHKYQRESSLKDLKAQHLAKKSKVIGKKSRWLEEFKSSRQVEQAYMIPCDEIESRYPSETLTACQSVNHETVSVNPQPFRSAPVDGCGQLSGLHGSVNASENNTIAKLPSSEEQLLIRPLTSGEEVTESIEKVISGGLYGSGNDSGNNIIAKPLCSGEQLCNKTPSDVGEVVKSLANGVIDGLHASVVASENCFSQNNSIRELSASQVQIPLGVSPNVEKVIERDGNELVGGLQGFGNASQEYSSTKEKVTDMPSKVQLPLGDSPSVQEVMKSAVNEIFVQLNCHQTPPCAQMANTEEPTEKENEQLSTEAAASDEIVHELVSKNPSQQLQQPPFVEIPLDKNQPTSPCPGCDHGIMLANPSEHQQLLPSAIIPVDTSRHTASTVEQAPLSEDLSVSITMESVQESHGPPLYVNTSRIDEIVHELVSTNPSQQLQQSSIEIPLDKNQPTSPSPGCDHGIILANPSEHQQLLLSAIIPVDTSRPTASTVEQAPHSEDLSVSITTEAVQESHGPPLHVNTNRIHPGPASVVESAPRREIPLVSLNAEPSRQFENAQLPLNRSILGPVCSPTSSCALVRKESPRVNQLERRVAINNNHQLVKNTPLLSDQVNSRTQLGTPPSTPRINQLERRVAINNNHQLVENTPLLSDQVNSRTQLGTPAINNHMDDSRSDAVLQGARQAAPQITAQRLTSNAFYNEYERLCSESERLVEVHENMKLHLKSDSEKELAEIRKKYELKLHDAEAVFLVKKKELDLNSMKVFMNGLYSQAFQSMAKYKTKTPQDVSSNLMQQVRLPYSQAQPTISPSTYTSSPSILSTCNRQNRPLFGLPTPQRASFQGIVVQARPLPYSATSFASLSQRPPGHPEPPHSPVYQSVHSSMGPLPTFIGDYPSLENTYLSRSASVPASCSNLGLLSPSMVGSNGGSLGTNMENSEAMCGFICLSDDD